MKGLREIEREGKRERERKRKGESEKIDREEEKEWRESGMILVADRGSCFGFKYVRYNICCRNQRRNRNIKIHILIFRNIGWKKPDCLALYCF